MNMCFGPMIKNRILLIILNDYVSLLISQSYVRVSQL